jgi:hypothetical protein
MEAVLASGSGRRPGLSPVQVMAAGLLLVAVVVAVWAVQERQSPVTEEVELLAGTVVSAADLAVMEAVFDRTELKDYRVQEGRLYVGRGQQSRFLRALVDAGALPPEFGGSLRRAVESDSPWRSKATQAELLRIATQEELALVIRTMPGIEQAAVLYDLDAGADLFRGSDDVSQTASVSVRTEAEVPLDPHRVQAIRVLVASSIAGLRADRVAVTDLRSGRVFDGPLVSDAELVAGDPERARAVAYERHVMAKIRQALTFIAGVVVEVNASAIESVMPTDKPAGSELATGPRAAANVPASVGERAGRGRDMASRVVQVSVAIPETYFERLRSAVAVAREEGDPTAAELVRLERLVVGLVPATAPWSRAQVTITRYPGRQGETAGATRSSVATSTQGSPGQASATTASPGFAAVVAGLGLPDLGLPPDRLLLVFGSVGLGLLGLLVWLFGRRESIESVPVPLATGSREAIDWPTLQRTTPIDQQGEAA